MTSKAELLQEILNAVPGAPDFAALRGVIPEAEWGSDPVRVRVTIVDVGEVLVQTFSKGYAVDAEITFRNTPPSVIGSTIHRLRRLA